MMKRFLKTILFGVALLIPFMASGQIYEPEGVNIPGQWNGFTNTNDASIMGNFRLSQRAFGGGQYLGTISIATTGGDTVAGTYEMLFTSGPESNTFVNKWSGATLAIDGFTSLTKEAPANNTITVENGYYYTLLMKDNGYENTEAAVFKTSAEPVSIDTATGVPTEAVSENEPTTIEVELEQAKSPEEKVFVRYSTDNFVTSDAIEITNFGTGTTGTAEIPGQSKNTSVDFYVLTTTIDKANWAGKEDLATIRFQNNGGQNYSYFYEADISPLNGAEQISRMPELRWFQLDNLAGYDLQLDNDSDFSSLVVDESGLSDTTFTVTQALNIYTDYYWRFKADTATSWSNTFTFKTVSEVTFANVQFPESAVIDEGSSSMIYGQVFVPGITELSGASSDINAWLGVNETNANPESWDETSWQAADFNATSTTAGNNDEYQLSIGDELQPGAYYYAYRYQYLDQDSIYGVIGGIWDDTTQVLGQLVVLDVPELNAPANAAENVTLEPELSWTTTDPNIAEYNLQISDDAVFTSPIVDEQNLETTSSAYTIGSEVLDYENTYFWRVRSEYDTTASGWSETYSFTTKKNIPGAVTLNSPAESATEIALQPEFSWTAESASSSFNIQVSSSSDFTQTDALIVDTEGLTETQFSVSDTSLLAAQQYYWRVQGENSAGSGPWSTARSFNTVVITPSLLSPADEAVDVPTTAPLTWGTIPGALNYDVQLSRNSAFSGNNVVVDSTAHADTVLTVEELSLNQLYYWRVKANYEGTSSEWSPAFLFTVKDAPPLKPELLSPDSGAVNVALNISLNWDASADAESYQVQLSKTSDFSSEVLLDSAGITGTSMEALELIRETSYYWRVRGYNTSGGFGDWSVTAVFTTLPEAPASAFLIAPGDSLTDLPIPVEFRWDSVAGATSYEFQFSNVAAFNFTSDSTLSDTSLSLEHFDSGTGYFWRVRTMNAGGISAWSSANYFETGVGGFEGPILINPKNEQMNTGTTVSFSWGILKGADSYQFQLSENPEFGSFAIDSSGIIGNEFNAESLEKGSMYYWRVRGEDSQNQSDWSEVFSFHTEIGLPGNVVLVAPADSAADIIQPITFSWRPAQGASLYELRLSEQASFSISMDSSAIQDTSLTLNSLAHNTSYYWKVRAINSAGKGAWSPTHYFTTNIALPGKTEPVNPEDAETVSSLVRFGWNETANAEFYELHVSATGSFDELKIDSSSIEDLTVELQDLEEGATYYWRVRGVNRAGAGAWSDTLAFTIEVLTSIGAEGVPDEFALYQNYPNPFNPTTSIQYDVKFAGQVKIEVYDVAGRLIQTLVNKRQTAGRHRSTFDAGSLASGLYLIRMEAPGFLQIRKMTLIK